MAAAMVDRCILPPALLLSATFAQQYQYLEDGAHESVAELTRQLSEHNLEHDPAPSDPNNHLFPRQCSFEAPVRFSFSSGARVASDVNPNEGPIASTSLSATHFLAPSSCSYADHSASSIRRQRQRALRSQCSSSHLQAISALVSRMMDKGEQCTVRSASPEEKDDCDMRSDEETMERSDNSEMHGDALRPTHVHRHSTRNCIAKDTRARKHLQRS